MQTYHDILEIRQPNVSITKLILLINCLVFIVMLLNGAGFWHSPNLIQLNWGANFGPATQDGQWWRLLSAVFLHFGVVHLLLNSWSLWDAGQLAERMYGHWRFVAIYLASGLCGNLLSLANHGNAAVSGGASGAIFGIYGAVLIFLWRERATLSAQEFKWLFGGGLVFGMATIALGFIVQGIDNSAHIGGLLTGVMFGIVLAKPIHARTMPIPIRLSAFALIIITAFALYKNMPAPKYRWSDELLVRNKINAFLFEDQAINRSWLDIMYKSKQGEMTFEQLTRRIDGDIVKPYELNFIELSQLPNNAAMPSAGQLEGLINYTQKRKDETKAMLEALKKEKKGVN